MRLGKEFRSSILFIGLLVFVALIYHPSSAYGGDRLYDYKFIQGASLYKKVLNEEKKLNRAELAAIICQLYQAYGRDERQGIDKEVYDTIADKDLKLIKKSIDLDISSTYSDASNIPDWAIEPVKYVTASKFMSGMPGKKFAFDVKVTGQQLAAVMLRMLGHENVKWDSVPSKLKDLGLNINLGQITRREAFDFIWACLIKPVMADGSTLGYKLAALTKEDVSKELETFKNYKPIKKIGTNVIYQERNRDERIGEVDFEIRVKYPILQLRGEITPVMKDFMDNLNKEQKKIGDDYYDSSSKFLEEQRKAPPYKDSNLYKFLNGHPSSTKGIAELTVGRFDNKIISLYIRNSDFRTSWGGTMVKHITYNIDSITGENMDISKYIIDLFGLQEKILDYYKKPAGRAMNPEDRENIYKVGKLLDIDYVSKYITLGEEGIYFFIDMREIAGRIHHTPTTVQIPYSDLEGIFDYESLF